MTDTKLLDEAVRRCMKRQLESFWHDELGLYAVLGLTVLNAQRIRSKYFHLLKAKSE